MRGLVMVVAAVVGTAMLIPATPARADLGFRKKKPASSDSATEAAPAGSETEGEVAPTEDGAAKPPAKTEYVPQADDKDRPRDPTLVDKPADAAVAKQAKKPEGPPIYTKWQFWAITGLIVVGAVAAVWGGSTLYHEIKGGDVRPCDPTFALRCYGEGR